MLIKENSVDCFFLDSETGTSPAKRRRLIKQVRRIKSKARLALPLGSAQGCCAELRFERSGFESAHSVLFLRNTLDAHTRTGGGWGIEGWASKSTPIASWRYPSTPVRNKPVGRGVGEGSKDGLARVLQSVHGDTPVPFT